MNALLLRHASTIGQEPEAPLTDRGQAEAAALIPVLQRLGAEPLYSSPYARALATIAPYATAVGLPVTSLQGLAERVLSPAPLENWLFHLQASFADPTHAAPGGESHDAVCRRAAPALQQIEKAGGARPCFVTHGALTAALFAKCDPDFGFEAWQDLRNPDLFEVTIKEGAVQNLRKDRSKAPHIDQPLSHRSRHPRPRHRSRRHGCHRRASTIPSLAQ